MSTNESKHTRWTSASTRTEVSTRPDVKIVVSKPKGHYRGMEAVENHESICYAITRQTSLSSPSSIVVDHYKIGDTIIGLALDFPEIEGDLRNLNDTIEDGPGREKGAHG